MVRDFLLELRKRGVELSLKGDRLVCRAAKGAITPDLAATLGQRKPEIVAFLREGLVEQGGTRRIPPILPAPRKELMPLSFTQERLWYLSQVESNPAVFNLPLCLQMTGALRVDVLQRCLDTICERHEALRTTVVDRDGVGFQKIHSPSGLPIKRLDVREPNREASRLTALRLLDREASLPFDLASGPAIRATLVCSSEEEHYLLVVTHHLFLDGSSLTIFLDELVTLYEAYSDGLPSPLKPPPLQFVDYAVWQREWLQGEALDEQLVYWKGHLGGKLPVLDLPTDSPRPPIRGSNGSKEPLRIPKSVVQKLAAIALEEGATTFMAMVTLFNSLLHRYAGQEDLVIGIPVANRTRRESEGIFGYIANTLVLRTDCSGAPTFREVVRRVRETCIGAFRHQDMPFQKIVEALRPPRDLSRTPIYQVFFTYEEVFTQPPKMGDLKLSRVIVGSTVARQDISIFLRQVDGDVLGSLEYNTELFTRETVLRFIGHFVSLAESAAADPDKSIGSLSLLTIEESEAFVQWNNTVHEYPLEGTIHGLFEQQVRQTPKKVAAICGDSTLSYAELDEKAKRLAVKLLSVGVNSGDLVGLYLDRSTDMLVGVLGILKSGAAYVPMDPAFPSERLGFMVEDASMSVIVTQKSLVGQLPPHAAETVLIDEELPEVPAGFQPPLVSSSDLAYVIFTSGSTGRPKGVKIPHRAVVNFLNSMRREPGLTADDILLSVTTLSFDIAGLELYLPLTTGATLVVATRESVLDGHLLRHELERSRATVMQATPVTWMMLLEAGWGGSSGLKILIGGEAVPRDLVNQLVPRVASVWNMYGPTETTIWSTVSRLEAGEGPVSIGRPIDNTQVHIVSPGMQLQPVGVVGELLIGGDGLALGYLKLPELTAEKFVADPFSGRAGARLYRTGDLAKWCADGTLECLGRIDHQVKIRGFRIELGEIEAVLAKHAKVRQCVVVAREDSPGDKRLVAYYVAMAGIEASIPELRNYLRSQLPEYMVPQHFVKLEAMPMTPNGKVDRKGLPKSEIEIASETNYIGPRTDMERQIVAIWQEVLKQEKIGVCDDFFEVGGHSLLATQVLSRINRLFNMQLPLLRLFDDRTVEALAEVVNTFSWAARGRQEVGSSRNENKDREFVEL